VLCGTEKGAPQYNIRGVNPTHVSRIRVTHIHLHLLYIICYIIYIYIYIYISIMSISSRHLQLVIQSTRVPTVSYIVNKYGLSTYMNMTNDASYSSHTTSYDNNINKTFYSLTDRVSEGRCGKIITNTHTRIILPVSSARLCTLHIRHPCPCYELRRHEAPPARTAGGTHTYCLLDVPARR